MGVTDRALVRKEIVPRFWVFREQKSTAQGPSARFLHQEEQPPPGSSPHSFQPSSPSKLLRNFWEFSQKGQAFYLS